MSIEDKLKIIKLIDKSVSYSIISEKFGIGRSTVSDIRKNKEKILSFRRQTVDMGMKKRPKTMKLGEDRELDQALYLWFKQKRMSGVPVTGPLLCAKAMELSKSLKADTKFRASEGWKWRFCKRHGIWQLSVQGEKLSANKEEADEFVASFKLLVKEKKFTLNQIFNCDETGLNFRLLPEVTVGGSFEKSASGRKSQRSG